MMMKWLWWRLWKNYVSRPPHICRIPGIRLRISTPAGPLVDADSEHLYFIAKYGSWDPCRPECPPGCDKHGWACLIPGPPDMPMVGDIGIVVEVKPIMIQGGKYDD